MDRIDKIIAIVRYLKEEGMAVGAAPTNNTSGPIAGLPPDSPPAYKKKKRPTIAYGGPGSRRLWLMATRNSPAS